MPHTASRRGMSLLISLAFIVIITILVVGFAETVRISRMSAASFIERSQADQYARSAVERVIATLNAQTADPAKNWISQPGQIIAGKQQDDTGTASVDERKILTEVIPLHSGAAPSPTPTKLVLHPPDLNIVTYREAATHVIANGDPAAGVSAPEMKVSWVYVRKSGALDYSQNPDTSKTNPDPIAGRYAYWTDDESSKINYNIAWGRRPGVNLNPPSHPTSIELAALDGFTTSYADKLREMLAGNLTPSTSISGTTFKFFNSPYDARRLDTLTPGLSAALEKRKFETTHFNSDPNTTFFNEPRIVLTCFPARAGWTKVGGRWVGVNGKTWDEGGQPRYIRILKDPEDETMDPGASYTAAIDAARMAETIMTLALRPAASGTTAGYMRRTDWPMVTGTGSFQSKYFSNYPATPVSASGISPQASRVGQMAVNIIDYVRSKESKLELVYPVIAAFDPTATSTANVITYNPNGSPGNGFIGLTRGVYITEVAVWLGQNTGAPFAPTSPNAAASPTINTGDWYYQFKVELFLPRDYGLASVDLSQLFLAIQGAGEWIPNYSAAAGNPERDSDVHRVYAGEVDSGSTILEAGKYAVITRAVKAKLNNTASPPATTRVGSTRLALEGSVLSNNYQFVPGTTRGFTSGIPISSNVNAVVSLETDDPRLNAHAGDWVKGTANTLGARNSRWSAGASPQGVTPEQDVDGGTISALSLYMPAPAGKTFVRSNGLVDDNTAGRVLSVGELGFIHTGYEPCASYFTGANGTGTAVPIPVGVPWRTLRLQPSQQLATVVPDWALMDLFTAPIAAPGEYNKYVYAPHDTSYGGRVNLNSKAEPYGLSRTAALKGVLMGVRDDATNPASTIDATEAGTLAQDIYDRNLANGGKQYGTDRYDSPGEIVEIKGIADKGEKSEEAVRQIMNLISTRGNTYTVYSIGQSLKQTPNGELIVLGEQRLQAMIERYSDWNGGVKFAPVYIRNLSP